jgi:hypothetical protein
MKSRRRIAFSKAQVCADWAFNDTITVGNCDPQNGVPRSGCTAAILLADVRFGSKADIAESRRHVRFVPKADEVHRSEESLLFDHLVGAQQDCSWN